MPQRRLNYSMTDAERERTFRMALASRAKCLKSQQLAQIIGKISTDTTIFCAVASVLLYESRCSRKA
jgi:hypothetical protein